MASKFGVFDHIEDISGTPTSRLFKDRLELIRMADQAGFAGYHFAEHHGSDLCMAPSQELFIAAASQMTSDIRLGPMVKLLPMHHPVRIIEDMCLLDQLTEGRLEFGVGRGPVPIEHYWFSHEWSDARERFADVLGIVAKALETGEISSENSRFFDFPTMPMATRPFQENIPFWYPGSPQIAGRYGMSLMWPGKINHEAYEQYLRAWHDHEGGTSGSMARTPSRGSATACCWRSRQRRTTRSTSPGAVWTAWCGARATRIASTVASYPRMRAMTPRALCARSTPIWTSPSSSAPALRVRSPTASPRSSTTGSSTTSASCAQNPALAGHSARWLP